MLKYVTVTGADERTDIQELLSLADIYPNVEFGLLVSKRALKLGRKNSMSRFVTSEWLNSYLSSIKDKKINTSCHVCGEWVTDIFNGNWTSDLADFIDDFLKGPIQRIQLNTHGDYHSLNILEFSNFLKKFKKNNKRIIFQVDNQNIHILNMAINQAFDNLDGLFDLSHGAGILPFQWPSPIEGIVPGYAGGLSPENVNKQFKKILNASNGKDFWIDAETHLRSSIDNTFDIKKVESFIKNIQY